MTSNQRKNYSNDDNDKKKRQFDFSMSEIKAQDIPIATFIKKEEIPEAITCIHCKKIVEPRGMMSPFERKIFTFLIPECRCEQAKADRARLELEKKEKIEQEKKKKKIKQLFLDSKISSRFKRRNFDNFTITPENERPFEVAKKYVLNFKKLYKDGIGLIFEGQYGTGKTHLATAIAIELLKQEIPVISGTLISLLEKIKQSWKNNKIDEWKIIEAYNTVDLLIVDDLGKEKPSEWALERLYSIVNERYENEKPILITTNFDQRDLIDKLTINGNDSTARAIVSRLNEMCRSVKCLGKDWRLH